MVGLPNSKKILQASGESLNLNVPRMSDGHFLLVAIYRKYHINNRFIVATRFCKRILSDGRKFPRFKVDAYKRYFLTLACLPKNRLFWHVLDFEIGEMK